MSTKMQPFFCRIRRKNIMECFQRIFFLHIRFIQGIRIEKMQSIKSSYIAFFSHFYAKYSNKGHFSYVENCTFGSRCIDCVGSEMWIIVCATFIRMHCLFFPYANEWCIQIKCMTALCNARKYRVCCLHSKLDAVDFITSC